MPLTIDEEPGRQSSPKIITDPTCLSIRQEPVLNAVLKAGLPRQNISQPRGMKRDVTDEIIG
jgi:hypothetical protein